MTKQSEIAKVVVRWDDQVGVTPGWYAETYDADGEMRDDSQKVWFPVDLKYYGRDQIGDVLKALAEAYPAAKLAVS